MPSSRAVLLLFCAWAPSAYGVDDNDPSLCLLQGSVSVSAVGKPKEPLKQLSRKPKGKQAFVATGDDPRSAADLSGVETNATGDLPIFLTGLVTNTVSFGAFCLIFSVLRRKVPLIYAGNVITSTVPFEPCESFFGWVSASLKVRMDDVVEHCGLDQAMMLEFNQFGMRLLAWLMVPLLFVMGPLHWFFGGDRSGDDHLSKLGMANVVDNHPWLYWVHSVLVWVVVILVQRSIYKAQGGFLERRKDWLKALPPPRATTILVQNIPEKYCTDKKVKEYFDRLFGSSVVEAVHVVKHTDDLVRLIETKENYNTHLQEALFKEKKTGQRPTMREYTGEQVDTIDFYTARVNESTRAIKDSRRRVQQGIAKNEPAYYSCNAFVTFKTRRHSEMALKVVFTSDDNEFVCEVPPEPADVIFADLKKNPTLQAMQAFLGYCLVAVIFWAYLPAVVGITYITDLDNLTKYVGFFKILADNPSAAAMWDAMAASTILNLAVGFVPTFFVYIFSFCFALKAGAWLQNLVQMWYFWFQVVYVLLITAVGASLFSTLDQIIESPTIVFKLLAATLPFATHFYLNFIPLQWASHGLNLTRWVQLGKFYGFKAIFETDVAKTMAEPEDQDYYGIGSRSARHSFILVLALVYASLTPLITVLAYIHCFVCRLVYGYLVVFAETRKPDLGGVFWVTNLMNIQRSMLIYITLMTGVLCFRDATYWPCIIAGSSVVYWHFSFSRFSGAFKWESLAIEDVVDKSKGAPKPTLAGTYMQPELED